MSNGNGIGRVLPYISLAGVIGVAVGAGIAWGGQNETVKNHGSAIKKHEQRIEQVETAITKQREASAVLNERTKNTQRDVTEIKNGVEDIKRALRIPRDPAR